MIHILAMVHFLAHIPVTVHVMTHVKSLHPPHLARPVLPSRLITRLGTDVLVLQPLIGAGRAAIFTDLRMISEVWTVIGSSHSYDPDKLSSECDRDRQPGEVRSQRGHLHACDCGWETEHAYRAWEGVQGQPIQALSLRGVPANVALRAWTAGVAWQGRQPEASQDGRRKVLNGTVSFLNRWLAWLRKLGLQQLKEMKSSW